MAHARQKVGLGLIGVVRQSSGGLQLGVLVAQKLVEPGPFNLGCLARGVVGANQQVTNDGVAAVAQGRDRDNGWQTTAIFADVGQLVNVLNAA